MDNLDDIILGNPDWDEIDLGDIILENPETWKDLDEIDLDDMNLNDIEDLPLDDLDPDLNDIDLNDIDFEFESEKYARPSDGKCFKTWIAEHNFETHFVFDCDGYFSVIGPNNSYQSIGERCIVESPTKLMDGKMLNEWMSTYYPQINLTPEQCNLIIETLDPYTVFVSHKEELFSIDFDDVNMDRLKQNQKIWAKMGKNTPNDIIEYACYYSYESLDKLTEKLAHTPYFNVEDYSACLNSLAQHCNEYQKLLDLYKQSRFENWKPVIKEDTLKQQPAQAEPQKQTEEPTKTHHRKRR